MRRYGTFIALVLIVLFAAGLRLYHLSTVPTELIVDEIDLYNSVHTIATTGHDIDGPVRPFLYSQFTRNPPIYGLAAYASSLAFGRTPFGLRFPAVVFGLVTVLLIYAIVLELTGRRDIALIAAFIMATQPIFVQFSRIAWESASELPFLLGGLYALLIAFRRDSDPSLKHVALGGLLLGLASYTYMAAWPYAVILGGAVVALNARRMRTWQSWVKISVGIEIWLLISAPALDMWFVDPLTSSRTARVATFAHGVSLDSLRVFAMNYLAHFRWSYLVSTGDPKPGVTWRYLNGFGAFYWFVIPLTALGLACASPYVRAKWTVAWLWIWLLAYPLGGALTNDGGGAPNAPRTLAGVPVFCVLAAIGLGFLMDRSRKIVLAAFGIASAVAIALFAGYYFTRYVHVNSNAWDSGTRAMFSDIRAHAYAYDRVCFFVHPAWYGIDSYVRFYLDDVPIQTIEDADDPACYLPGTMLVTDTDHADARPGFVKIASVPDVDGATFAVIRGRPRL